MQRVFRKQKSPLEVNELSESGGAFGSGKSSESRGLSENKKAFRKQKDVDVTAC